MRTAADMVELYDDDPAKIDIIYQSCHPQFAQPVSDVRRAELRSRYALPQRYIALVGTVERRKNAMLAVRALPMIDPEVKLSWKNLPRPVGLAVFFPKALHSPACGSHGGKNRTQTISELIIN